MSEASAVTVSSSNLSASAVSSDTLINGISGVNLENIMNDAIISQDPIELLLAINSQIEYVILHIFYDITTNHL